jgi:magnesium transporter
MARLIKRISTTAALPPGALVHVGEKRAGKVRITVIDYDESQFQEKEVKTAEECFSFKDTPAVTWINIDGIHDIGIIEKIGEHFGLHPLVLEDIVNTGQRPELEEFEKYIFIVLKMLMLSEKNGEIDSEQVSLILGKNYVISFQEKEGDVFNPIRERIRNNKGKIRKKGADYLAYCLMDAIVDNYFIILEKIGEKSEEIEEGIVTKPTSETLQVIQRLKREMIFLRKSVWPLREVISTMQRQESHLIQKSTGIYLRDVYDHTIQVIDTIETLRDTVSSILDIYLSSVSNKMNEIMKVLTIIAVIFIPLTFVAGVYGMNFKYMPELQWHWGYFMVLGVMAVIGILMLIFFKRKKWM